MTHWKLGCFNFFPFPTPTKNTLGLNTCLVQTVGSVRGFGKGAFLGLTRPLCQPNFFGLGRSPICDCLCVDRILVM